MSKIHITLVGGQPAPIYNGIVATRPDKVVYIYSTTREATLTKLLKEMPIPSEKHILDVTSPQKIKALAESLAGEYKNDEITVNISSGLKSWSHWFGIIFNNMDNASIIYVDQNNVLWNYKTMEQFADFEFDMHTLFRLYGNDLKNNFTPFKTYTKEDFDVIKEIETIRAYNHREFTNLTAVLSRHQQHVLRNQKQGGFDRELSFVRWDKELCRVEIGFKKNNSTFTKILESPNVISLIFNSGWFEVKVAKILSEWEYAKDLCLNCKFPYVKNIPKNEVDIIVNTGNKVLFVECKTQITTSTDIDKFRSVIKNYGGMGSKGLFVTDAKMTDMAKAKCEELGILTFSLQDGHLGIDCSKALQLLLNTELYNINIK